MHSQFFASGCQSSLRFLHPLFRPQCSSGFCPQSILSSRLTPEVLCSGHASKTPAKPVQTQQPISSANHLNQFLRGGAQAPAFFSNCTDGSDVQPALTTNLSMSFSPMPPQASSLSPNFSSGFFPWARGLFSRYVYTGSPNSVCLRLPSCL